MQLLIKIGGVDVSTKVNVDSVSIQNIINKRIDTCSLSVTDRTGSTTITSLQEIIISNTAETTRYFAGYVTEIDIKIDGITKTYDLQCQDYTILLDGALVNESYAAQTVEAILADLFTSYLGEVNASTYVVATGKTLDKKLFNRVTLREAVDMLSDACGFDWYIDYNKNLHFFPKETNLAPFNISDSPDLSTTYPAEQMTYRKETRQIINRVTVVGGYYLSDDQTFDTIPANGTEKNILLPYVFAPEAAQTQIRVDHNTGSDGTPVWTADVVGIDNIDALGVAGVTVLFNRYEKLLKFQTAPANLAKAVRVRARYRVPVLVRTRSDASYALYSRWFDGKVIDVNLISRADALLAGKSVLADYAMEREYGTFALTNRDGLVAGQKINIVDSLRGLNGDYLITEVDTSLLGGTICGYTVSFGEYNPDLIDLLIALKRNISQQVAARDDEVLNELLSLEEDLDLSEAVALHSDDFSSGIVNRWIALPPTTGAGNNVQHELLDAQTEATGISNYYKGAYAWG